LRWSLLTGKNEKEGDRLAPHFSSSISVKVKFYAGSHQRALRKGSQLLSNTRE
jgi:hypothetical protein